MLRACALGSWDKAGYDVVVVFVVFGVFVVVVVVVLIDEHIPTQTMFIPMESI